MRCSNSVVFPKAVCNYYLSWKSNSKKIHF